MIMEIVTLVSCAMALFYFWSWREAATKLETLQDAVQQVAEGNAFIDICDGLIYIREKK